MTGDTMLECNYVYSCILNVDQNVILITTGITYVHYLYLKTEFYTETNKSKNSSQF